MGPRRRPHPWPSDAGSLRTRLARGIPLGLLALILGCEGSAGTPGEFGSPPIGEAALPGFPRTLLDDSGHTLELARPPERLLSLVPSATLILLALGEGDRLVGRTDFDQDPALADLPSVGGGLGASIETIVSLAPDLVLHFDAGSDPATPAQLDAAGLPHLAVRPDRIADVYRIIDLLGRTLGREGEAAVLRDRLAEELAAVDSAVRGARRPRVAILLSGNPPLVAGGGTFLHELVEIAGGENALADTGELYTPTSVEWILTRGVDLLLLSEEAPVPRGLEAFPVRRIPLEVQVPGLHLGESARRLLALLHPDRVP